MGALAVLGLILGATFSTGLFFWVLIKPDFGLAYNINDPSHPFTFKKSGDIQAPPAEEPELSFNETLAMLRDKGCALVEGEPENLDPDKCVYMSQKEFIEEALRRKLVFLNMDEAASTLYVPEREGHVAWQEPKEPV
jgi:hypothetical protein